MPVEFSHASSSRKPDALDMLPNQSARRAVHAFRKGGRLVGMTHGQFSLLDLLAAPLKKTGPAEVWLSTWTAGIRDAKAATMLLERGTIAELRLLVDRSFASRQPAYCAAVRRMFGDYAVRCTRTHAKIALLRNAEFDVAVRSSMNLNRNPRFEQYDVDESPELCEFFVAHFEEMAAEMPKGPTVPTSEVDAVFDRALRGINPFDTTDRVYLLAAGAPLEGSAEEWGRWVRSSLRDVRCAKRRPGTVRQVSELVGLEFRELSRALLEDPGERPALSEDVARALVDALE